MNNGYGNNNYYNSGRYSNNFSSPPERNTPEPIVIGGEPKNQSSGKNKRIGAGTIALILVFCILVSAVVGAGSSYLTSRLLNSEKSGTPSESQSPAAIKPTSATVIYENVSASSDSIEEGSTAAVAAAVSDSVVEIVIEKITSSAFYGQLVGSGAGSGVVITSDGYIATNNHVIEDASNITVRMKNGDIYKADLVSADAESDLALIKVSPKESLTPVVFADSDSLKVGQQVICIGNPLGTLGGTVTSGIISALDRVLTIEGNKMKLFQTDAAINPGNSGGGIFNMKGELVGIVDAKSVGTDVEGLGYAIPSSTAKKVLGELLEYGYVRGRIDLGLTYVDIDNRITAMYYRVDSLGCYIISSEYSDELKQGDRIIAVNDKEVSYSSDIKDIKEDLNVGDVVKITVVRDGQNIDVNLVCHEKVQEGKNINFET